MKSSICLYLFCVTLFQFAMVQQVQVDPNIQLCKDQRTALISDMAAWEAKFLRFSADNKEGKSTLLRALQAVQPTKVEDPGKAPEVMADPGKPSEKPEEAGENTYQMWLVNKWLSYTGVFKNFSPTWDETRSSQCKTQCEKVVLTAVQALRGLQAVQTQSKEN